METIFEVKNVSFTYEEKSILDDISFKVESGSFVSIIGPNGSGKSTLLKNMSSILLPSKGRILFKGKDIQKYKRKELAREMAFVPQNISIDFEFTVMDIVLMGRAPFLRPFQSETIRDIEIAEQAMTLTNVIKFKDKKINEISGGERQRAIIASALAQTPNVVLLDEPISNLDIQHQIEVLGILRKLNRENDVTVVTVLHDLNLAAEFSDIIMLIKDGRIVKCGSPIDVITPESIREAYETDIYMMKNPISGKPHIIPIPVF